MTFRFCVVEAVVVVQIRININKLKKQGSGISAALCCNITFALPETICPDPCSNWQGQASGRDRRGILHTNEPLSSYYYGTDLCHLTII